MVAALVYATPFIVQYAREDKLNTIKRNAAWRAQHGFTNLEIEQFVSNTKYKYLNLHIPTIFLDSGESICPRCMGAGSVDEGYWDGFFMDVTSHVYIANLVTCDACSGMGKVNTTRA